MRLVSDTTAPTFKIGDIVQLKSSGPRMTVTRTDCWVSTGEQKRARGVAVAWFDLEDKLHDTTFSLEVIELAPTHEEELLIEEN